MVVKVRDIQRGDILGDTSLWYKALSPASGPDADGLWRVEVQWYDGGIAYRWWDEDDADTELPLWEGRVPEHLRG